MAAAVSYTGCVKCLEHSHDAAALRDAAVAAAVDSAVVEE
jgi:hypothetical protein